jgi:ABC-2 type transport system ATP-binding protein
MTATPRRRSLVAMTATTTTSSTSTSVRPRGRPAPPAGPGALPPAIDVRGLSKRYGRRTVVDGLDVTVPTGAVAGFVGPNGAGKTTTLRMLLGLVRPNGGGGTVLGEPLAHPMRYLTRIGALIESPAFYPSLSGERNLVALAILGGLDTTRVPAVLDEVGLGDRGGDAFRTYSLGMKQRLAIAAALLSDPELLVFDEPTNGLDPIGIRQMRELIRTLADGGSGSGSGENRDGARSRTVLVSSHLLAEVEQICDWLIVVDGGRLAYQGPADGLMAAGSRGVLLRPEHGDQLGMLGDLLAGLGLPARRDGERLRLDLLPADGADADGEPETIRLIGELNRAAQARGITLVEITPTRASLEDRYQGLVDANGSARPVGG